MAATAALAPPAVPVRRPRLAGRPGDRPPDGRGPARRARHLDVRHPVRAAGAVRPLGRQTDRSATRAPVSCTLGTTSTVQRPALTAMPGQRTPSVGDLGPGAGQVTRTRSASGGWQSRVAVAALAGGRLRGLQSRHGALHAGHGRGRSRAAKSMPVTFTSDAAVRIDLGLGDGAAGPRADRRPVRGAHLRR